MVQKEKKVVVYLGYTKWYIEVKRKTTILASNLFTISTYTVTGHPMDIWQNTKSIYIYMSI